AGGQDHGRCARACSPRPARAGRRRFLRSGRDRRGPRRRRGRDAGDGAVAGDEGPSVVSRRAQHRPPGPGRDLDRDHSARARAGGHGAAVSRRLDGGYETIFSGLAVSVGVAVGSAFTLAEPVADEGAADPDAALAALARVAQELARTAERLRSQGRETQAEIIEANRLMAEDPTLAADVAEAAGRLSASAALRLVTERRADALAALDHPLLA